MLCVHSWLEEAKIQVNPIQKTRPKLQLFILKSESLLARCAFSLTVYLMVMLLIISEESLVGGAKAE
jgi:hypothetical protein